jgi:DNA (cytosine-5)-methyltransferase 1
MKILNLYACLGGNRYKWGDDHEITAVELDPELARMYKERFPNDTVIITDAHQYLLDHYKKYDFIWSSPPCPTHSRARFWSSKGGGCEVVYPDMKLYEEIIFLENYFEGKYCVENVIPYYEPLVRAQKRGRHLYWCNFILPNDLGEREIQIGAGANEVKRLCEFHEYDFTQYKGEQRIDKIARNLVDFEAGKTILETAMGIINGSKSKQADLFSPSIV